MNNLIYDCCKGIQQNKKHLNIRPENILVQNNNERRIFKIINFEKSFEIEALIKSKEEEDLKKKFDILTINANIFSDELYRAPELHECFYGELFEVQDQSDWFSLGMIFL